MWIKKPSGIVNTPLLTTKTHKRTKILLLKLTTKTIYLKKPLLSRQFESRFKCRFDSAVLVKRRPLANEAVLVRKFEATWCSKEFNATMCPFAIE